MEDREEKEEREERERKQRERQKQYDRLIKREEENLDKMRAVQEEMGYLNRSLNACINIASESILSIGLRKRYDRMTQANYNSYARANRSIDQQIDDKKKEIERLQEEKIQTYEQDKKEAREQDEKAKEKQKEEEEQEEKKETKDYSNE
ncbi:MAG: hypothetical protein J6X28_05195 [Bacilli bacterium]|nr:hypothetical protein [Bacilli bacterium]